jgi:hypothetical protein
MTRSTAKFVLPLNPGGYGRLQAIECIRQIGPRVGDVQR